MFFWHGFSGNDFWPTSGWFTLYFCVMLAKLFKAFVGDKSANDIKEVQPVVDRVKEAEKSLGNLSADDLRGRSADLRERIRKHVESELTQIDQLHAQAAELPLSQLDQKEALFEQIDALELQVNEGLEEVLEEVMPEAFALVKETARRFSAEGDVEVTATELDREIAASRDLVRVEGDKAYWAKSWTAAGSEVTWDMVHYDVQLIGGVALHRGKVAEMQTGEGKTLVATLPVFLNALAGRGVHVVTVNDYLARRDAEWMGPLYEFHGLTVDCIDKHQPNSEARRKAYKCDVTFGTNNEFGFDYLRDNMATRPEQLVQRKHHFAIVDEVDSVLIDEARTPLIISGPTPKGDEHEFDQLKPKVVSIVKVQQQAAQGFLSDAKKLLVDGASKEDVEAGGLALYRAFRALPKSKPLIKFLSQDGMRQQLLKTEGYYLADNQREMHKADAELFFVIDEKQNQIELTEKGIEYLVRNMEDEHFFTMPDLATELVGIDNSESGEEEKLEKKQQLMQDYGVKSARIHSMNQLLKAYTLFEKDIEYVVMDNKVKIVDEQTGRIMEGRRYSDGLHQAIESKEGVKVEAATQTYATVTLQNYFRMYHKLAGMTGTAETEAGEFWDIYELDVMVIPTNRPIARKDRDDLVYKTKREKLNAVIDDVVELSKQGRPVLVGTTTVEISELLSKMLGMRSIKHQVLNAKMHQREAEVVSEAGKPGTVTIATNMAGRGTDIKLSKEVKDSGGLAIIGTERHDSRRVDRQLRGRSGRQGDPGSSQFYVSLEDDLMRLFGSERVSKMMDRMGHKEGGHPSWHDHQEHRAGPKEGGGEQLRHPEAPLGIRRRDERPARGHLQAPPQRLARRPHPHRHRQHVLRAHRGPCAGDASGEGLRSVPHGVVERLWHRAHGGLRRVCVGEARGIGLPDLPACRGVVPGQVGGPRPARAPGDSARARRREERLQEHLGPVHRRPEDLAGGCGHRAECPDRGQERARHLGEGCGARHHRPTLERAPSRHGRLAEQRATRALRAEGPAPHLQV